MDSAAASLNAIELEMGSFKGSKGIGRFFFVLTPCGDGEREDEEGELKYKKKLSLSLSSLRHMVRDTVKGT